MSSISSHCANFSLSDPKNEEFANFCRVPHTDTCHYCEIFPRLIQKIKGAIESAKILSVDKTKLIEMDVDLEESYKNIDSYKNHLIRGLLFIFHVPILLTLYICVGFWLLAHSICDLSQDD